jgi:hypothetical protein
MYIGVSSTYSGISGGFSAPLNPREMTLFARAAMQRKVRGGLEKGRGQEFEKITELQR